MKGKPYWLLTLIFLLMILIGTLSPRDIIVTLDPGSDKNYHLLAFALLVMPLTFQNLKNAYWLLPVAVVFGAIAPVVAKIMNKIIVKIVKLGSKFPSKIKIVPKISGISSNFFRIL